MTGARLDPGEVLARLKAAGTPGEAARIYRGLARRAHPDAPGGDGEEFARLSRVWSEYRGADSAVSIETSRDTYRLGPRTARGDLADLFPVVHQRHPCGHRPRGEERELPWAGGARPAHGGLPPRELLVKLPRDPRDSDLLRREAAALARLRDRGEARHRAYVPRLVESFGHRDAGTGARRTGNVLVALDGFRTLAEVRAAYPGGVDPRDAAWMWRRLLVALGNAHRAGVVHGAVLPEHVLVHPEEHGLVLVDWCYSVTEDDPAGHVPALVDRHAGRYPPEVAAREPATGATDVHMATGCMTELMGDRAPKELRLFAKGCRLASQRRRPGDAWRLLGELDELLERLYGRRRFRPFTMPPPGGAAR